MGLDLVHISRHHLGCQPYEVQWLPQAPPGPGPDGTMAANKMLVVAGFDPSASHNVLSLVNMRVVLESSGASRAAELEELYSLFHSGSPRGIATCDIDPASDACLVTTGSSTGTIHLLKLRIPRFPGSGPEDGEQMSYTEAQVHRSGVTAIDVHPAQFRLLSSSAGDLAVHDLTRLASTSTSGEGAELPGRLRTGGCAGFWAVKWASYNEAVTASAAGGLQLWDVRSGVSALRVSPSSWGGGALCALDTNASRPLLCLSGSTDGTVALWDLRFTKAPREATVGKGGEVWSVQFTASGGEGTEGSALSAGFYCTGEGTVGIVSERSDSLGMHLITEEPGASVVAMAASHESGLTEDVACVTSAECLTYIHGRVTHVDEPLADA